ncbi:MAG: hypothetical protein Q4F65_03265, partial [Propionibacteriaceae bacterium]|nr:hypothetical protein [Propionibacteriaceae bacterium]
MSHRVRAALGVGVGTLLLASCALPSSAPAPAQPTATAVPSPGATPSSTPQRPAWTVRTLASEDPALPILLAWPHIPGTEALNTLLAQRVAEREAAFRSAHPPSPEEPPELRGTWETVLDAPAWVGVRLSILESSAASEEFTSAVFYGERMAGQALTAEGLIAPTARLRAVDAVVDALLADGRGVVTELATAPEIAGRVLTDLVFSPRGELVVRVGEGVLLPAEEGEVVATLRPSVVEGLLSEAGRDIRDAATAVPVVTDGALTDGLDDVSGAARRVGIPSNKSSNGESFSGVVMRRYDEPIAVRSGEVAGEPAPVEFVWRRRL